MGDGRPLIILHGLFGSSDNWLTIGKSLSENFSVYLVDQRNHGQSFHDKTHDFKTMADDLLNFIKEHGIEQPSIIGHSMGGKVAMQFAMSYPNCIKTLVVVDISPRGYNVHHGKILEGLKSIPLPSLESRKQADDLLAEFVPDNNERQFLLKNLGRSDGGFEWKINLPVLDANIGKIVAEISGLPFSEPTLFIKGETSNYIRDFDLTLISKLFPNSEVATVKSAGHWVHAEQPEMFLRLLRNFFLQKAG